MKAGAESEADCVKEIMMDNENQYSTDSDMMSENPDSKKKKQNKKHRMSFGDKCRDLWHDRRPWHKRLIVAALASLAFVYTLFVFGILEVYIANINFYTFAIDDLLPPTIVLAVSLLAIMTLVLFLLRGRIFNYFVTMIFSSTVCAYTQCNFLGKHMDSLDGSEIQWEGMTKNMLVNLLIWAVIFIIPFIVHYFSRKTWRRMVSFVSALLVLMQTAGLVKLVVTSDFVDVVSNGYLSNSTIYEVSPQKNVIMFLLDRFDYIWQEEIFEAYPELKDEFDDFTTYDNVCGSYSRTFPSVCYMLTGVKCEYDIPIYSYFKKAWTEGTFLKDIKDAGYQSKIYTEVNYVIKNTNNAVGKIDNIGTQVRQPNIKSMMTSMIDLSMYRYSPLAMKPFFWCYTGDLENVIESADSTVALDIHSTDDPAFYANLVSEGLSVKEDSPGSFIFYHMRGAHDPYTMDSDGSKKDSGYSAEDRTKQILGNFKMIRQYMDDLKELGLYDDTTIIITADHGRTGYFSRLSEDYSCPTRQISLMVKPAGASDGQPMKYDSRPLTQDNIRATVLKALNIDHSGYGRAIDEVPLDDTEPRYFYMNSSEGYFRDKELVTYKIVGDIKDVDNWSIESVKEIEYPFYDAN